MTRLNSNSFRGLRYMGLLLALCGVSTAWAQQVLRLNCGGATSTFTGANGEQWVTDRNFTGGDLLYTSDPIGNTQDRYLYATARTGLYTDFSYKLPVANGTYKLTFKFAEIQYWNKGDRVFNVTVNGTKVLNNFDIMAEVPSRTALDKSFDVTVTNGAVEIAFASVAHRPIVSAIKLEPSTTQPVTVSVSPATADLKAGATQQFTATVTGATDKSVTWSATEGTISAAGLYTAPSSVTTAHTATVTAKSVADSMVSASATVNLKTPVVVTISPTSANVVSGGTAQFTATVTGTSDTRVAWTASTGTITSAGLFTAPNVTVATNATVTAQSVADTSVSAVAQVKVAPPNTGTPVYVESNGLVSVEAESGTIVNRAQQWTPQTSAGGFSGASYLTALPNNGANYDTGYAGVAPEVQYQVKFATAGTYYVWVRGYSTGPADDSINVGVDGNAVASGSRLSMFTANAWSWSDMQMDNAARVSLQVASAGVHTINVWMREDGFSFDKVVLSTNANFTPSGTGPAESLIDGAPAPAASLSVSPNSLSFSTAAGSNPASQNVNIGGSNGLSWTASKNQSWLTLSATSGNTPATLAVGADTASLSAGTYNGAVTITAAGASGSPATVNVTLTITAAAPLTPAPATGSGNQWYVAPNGSSSGDGSINKPWDLASVFANSQPVRPGDTVWLRGGTYGGEHTQFSSKLQGTASAPIIVRGYPGERATVIGGIGTYSPYTWYWGFEVMNTATDRSDTRNVPECMDTYEGSTGVRIINMVLHDCNQGLGYWIYSPDSEAHGNVIFYNGWQGPNGDRGHGHGIYTQNKDGSKMISDNIIFDQEGLGIQAYGSGSTWLQNVTMDGNIVFNNGSISNGGKLVDNILVAIGSIPKNVTVSNNYTYHTPSRNDGYSRLGWQWSGVDDNISAKNNYWIGGGSGEASIEVWNWNSVTFTGNTVYCESCLLSELQVRTDQSVGNYTWDNNRYYGSGKFNYNGTNQGWDAWKSATGKDGNSTFTAGAPTGVWTFVRPNKYEAGRGNIAIYNWDLRSSVDVDVSSVVKSGARYEVRDAQNFFGPPIASGTYGGGTISIPMTGLTKMRPVGNVGNIPPHTAPQFGAFVIFSR